MRKILALALLVTGLTVAQGSTASAYYGCGVGWFPPAYGNPGWGYASCQVTEGREMVRVEFKCANSNNQYDPNGNVGNGWFVGPWIGADGVHSTQTCNASYPHVALIQYNIMVAT